jgi:basic amino acid/polyamine antiporter, APA family
MAAQESESAAWLGRLPGSGSTVSLRVATAIVVADMVGVGVFTSLGFQVKDIPSGFSILLLWTVGGIVALCGVFSYGELGAMFPRSSGEYNFLSRAFHPAFGFLARRYFPARRRWRWPLGWSGWCRWCNSAASGIPAAFNWPRPFSRSC